MYVFKNSPKTLPACSTKSSTVVLQGKWAEDIVGESGVSKELFPVPMSLWNAVLCPLSLAIRFRKVLEKILSSKIK